MSFEAFDDWDEKFLDQAIRLEEEAISSRNPTQAPAITTTTTSLPHVIDLRFDLDFSPPRELSQRFAEKHESGSSNENDRFGFEVGSSRNGGRGGGAMVAGNLGAIGRGGKDREVERLKRELGRVSKQLKHLENECAELKKDRDSKDQQLKCAYSQIESKDTEIHGLKEMHTEYDDHPQVSLQLHNTRTSLGKAGPRFSISETKGTHSTPWIGERTPKGLSCTSNHALELTGDHSLDHQLLESYGPGRKDVQTDGLSAASELKRRIFIDSDSTTSNGYSIQKIVLPEAAMQPKFTKAIGIQTDISEDCSHCTMNDELSSQRGLSNKLFAIWNCPREKRSGRDFLSKLFVTCAADFDVLFGYMNLSSKIALDCLADGSFSDVTLQDKMAFKQSNDVAKVSRLSIVLTKISKGMVQLNALLEELLDLCNHENVVVVHKSLRIVHVVLQYMLSSDIRSDRRDNVTVIHMHSSISDENKISKHKNLDFRESEEKEVINGMNQGQTSSTLYFDVENLFKKELETSDDSISVSTTHWIPLFEIMRQIAVGNTEECIRVEATSIMNLILMRTNPNSERERFGLMPLFESVSRLLRKEVGLCVQNQAVRLLFLLLNSPKLLTMFCTNHKDDAEPPNAADVPNDSPISQGAFNSILEGLAECVSCRGHGTQELKLCRHAIIVLAFIASSGKSGFETLLDMGNSNGINFLELIVRTLELEMDAEAAVSAESQDHLRERSLLMREALIFLNRLASNPAYSRTVLVALTSSRLTASLTVDVANRLYQRSRGRSRRTNKKLVDTEIADLAQAFRARVFAFLGDIIS